MPKKLIEINKFTGGIVSTPSATDIDEQAAKYSSNIDPITADGRLQGIDNDKILTDTGFKSNISDAGTSVTGKSVNMAEFITAQDKQIRSAINLIGVTTNSSDSVTTISAIKDIYGSSPTSLDLLTGMQSTVGEYDLKAHDNKVYVGLGGSSNGYSKVVMHPNTNGIIGADDTSLGVFDARLVPPDDSTLSGMFSEFMTFPLHGTLINTPLSYDDSSTPGAKIYADYDFDLDNSSDISGETLYTAIQAGGVLAGIQVGQTFKIDTTGTSNDFLDNAMEQWKEYDYDKSVSGVTAGDLFMYCGNTYEGAPVLRFLGTLSTQGGTPSCMYAYKEDSSILYKISTTKTVDATAFGAGNITISKNAGVVAATDLITIARQTSRITQLDLAGIDGWESNYISAISACHSPPLFNSINLIGGLNDPHVEDSEVYYNNGHIKILYRHGVFYIAGYNQHKKLFRLNAIDFHNITNTSPSIDSLSLSFDRIPNQLEAEDGNGIIRRTIEDQDVVDNSVSRNNFDPKVASWSNTPQNVYILGICETFECGKLDLIEDKISTFTGKFGWKFTTRNQSRLTTGDKVRFSSLLQDTNTLGESYHDAFNTSSAWEVSVVDDGDAFYINTEVAAGIKTPALGPEVGPDTFNGLWWNSKVWILYGKKDTNTTFNDWDLFLYDANTIDIDSSRELYMADRTPPYHQARYYYAKKFGSFTESKKLYYPGQFAFIKQDISPGETSSGVPQKLEESDLSNPLADIGGIFNTNTGLPEFGIYDKAGRWSDNGVQRVQNISAGDAEAVSRPMDWTGGEDGPGSWYKDGADRRGTLRGDLCFGHNIGWDIGGDSEQGGRRVSTTKNSLHPVVPYSSLYNGSLHYSGWNSRHATLPTLKFDDAIHFESDYDTPFLIRRNNNRPKHSVTFLGKVRGKFVVSTGVISRSQMYDGAWQDDIRAKYGTRNYMDNKFTIHDSEALGAKTKEYHNEQVLFTIDDFSGHRGSVYAIDDNSLDISRSVTGDDIAENVDGDFRAYTAGVEKGRPNWGGPEIENPIYLATTETGGGQVDGTKQQSGSHSSVNGGLYDRDNLDDTDKGWDGYAPPYLFNPGSGYYVYINRSWKSMMDYQPDAASERSDHHSSSVWGFQTEGMTLTDRIEVNSNRFNNFSSTALSDNFSSHKEGPDEDSNSQFRQPWMTDSIELPHDQKYMNTRFYTANRTNDNLFNTDDNPVLQTHQSNRHYRGMPSFAQSICTMHKISIDDMGDITSIFPIILESTVDELDGNPATSDFHVAYLCGTDRSGSASIGSGALIVRTNYDYIWDKEANNTSLDSNVVSNTTYTGDVRHPRLFSNIVNVNTSNPSGDYSSSDDGIYPVLARGTHYAEIIDITDGVTNYTPEVSSEMGAFTFRQAAFDKYNNTLTGGRLLLAAQTPWIPLADHTLEHDWWIQANGLATTTMYFGHQDNAFARDEGGDDDVNYEEDSGGTFFTEDSGDFWTSDSDATILTSIVGYMALSNPTVSNDGILDPGKYYYKIAFEYDNQYESPLITNPRVHTLASGTADQGYTYIQIQFGIAAEVLNNLNKRITGLVLYRKFEGGDEDEYRQVKFISFEDQWVYNSTTDSYLFTVYDRDNLGPTYTTVNGIDELLRNTSLNYGLSTILHGYMYVTKAWHTTEEDVKRYVFRSQPDNFFAFDWQKDFAIMPEEPVAMADYNSRLYVWTKNNLYKIDPHSMLIEDTYEGIGIIDKNSFVKTEFGLCFMDANNVYIHDGNKPTPIADPILYSSNDSIMYLDESGTDGYIKLEQGYRELIKQTIANGHRPNIYYSGLKNSFVINVSDSGKNGKVLAYNITRARWDFWDAPSPSAVATSKESKILINDGSYLWDYIGDTSDEFTSYKRREWSWFSKDISFGLDTQDKLFRNITITGTPSMYNYANESISLFGSDSKTESVQAYVDDDQVALTIQNKFYDTINLGGVKLSPSFQDNSVVAYVSTSINPLSVSGGVGTQGTSGLQTFLRPGHLIKIDDEILLITNVALFNSTSSLFALTVTRGVMGTTAANHTSASPVYVVSPKLKFPSGTKGKNLSIRLLKQKGYVDSIGITYKSKSIK